MDYLSSTATTVAATTTTVGTTATTVGTTPNITTAIGTTTKMSVINSMVELCPENTLTCFNGGTCYQISDDPHCMCTRGFAGAQCELFDTTIYKFESTSTNNSLDMTETIIALAIICAATILIIVGGVLVYLKYRQSFEQDRNERITDEEEGRTVGRNTNHEVIRMLGDKHNPVTEEMTSQV